MPLVLVAPGLLSFPAETFASDRNWPRLAALAAPRAEVRGIGCAMLAAAGWSGETGVAPLAALGAGATPGEMFVLIADPVHFEAGHADVVLTRIIDDLAGDEADALIATLSAHFAVDGLRFIAPRANAWFALSEEPRVAATTPTSALIGKSLIAHLTQGAQAATWRRMQDEAGMLLHEHPVNLAREARGAATVNALWFWGGGRIEIRDSTGASVDALAAPGQAGDIARGMAHASDGRELPWQSGFAAFGDPLLRDRAARSDATRATIVVTEAIRNASDVDEFARAWLAPALDRLERKQIDALDLVADGAGTAATWHATPPGLLARWRSKLRPPPFRLPVTDDR
jgi:hypothetical protein